MLEDIADGGDIVLALPAEWIVEEPAPQAAPIRLVVVEEAVPISAAPWYFRVPRVVDYLIVAVFMFFVL